MNWDAMFETANSDWNVMVFISPLHGILGSMLKNADNIPTSKTYKRPDTQIPPHDPHCNITSSS